MSKDIDCRFSFILSNAFLPNIEYDNYIIDISYNDKNYKVKYPMESPFTIILRSIFTKENTKIDIVILHEEMKKYRKLAKGQINISRQFILSEKWIVDKFIQITLYKSIIEKNYGSNIVNAISSIGKIHIKGYILDPIQIHQQNLNQNSIFNGNNKKTKGKEEENKIDYKHLFISEDYYKDYIKVISLCVKNYVSSNSKIRKVASSSILQNNLSYSGNDTKNKKKTHEVNNKSKDYYEERNHLNDDNENLDFSEGNSDVSMSIIEGIEEDCVRIEEVNKEMNEFVDKVKEIFEKKFEEIIPKNQNDMKEFVNNLTKQIETIAEGYISNLEDLNKLNMRIKEMGDVYYEKYKQKKAEFLKEKEELRLKNEEFEKETKENINENMMIKEKYNDFRNEICYYKSVLGLEDSDKKEIFDDDIYSMLEILVSIKGEVDIFQGLTNDQSKTLNEMIDKYNQFQNEKEEISRKIIEKIEIVVNDLYNKDIISYIEIVPNTEYEYVFNEKVVVLKWKNDDLIVESEKISLEKWLMKNFKSEKGRKLNN